MNVYRVLIDFLGREQLVIVRASVFSPRDRHYQFRDPLGATIAEIPIDIVLDIHLIDDAPTAQP